MLIDGDWTNMGHTFNENTNVDIEGIENPIEYFKKFFSDEMIQLICDQTNLYSTQSNIVRRSIGTTKGEIERLLAVNFDKLFKLRPLLRSLKRNCLKVIPEEDHSIDEQIIPFKGRLSHNGKSGFCYSFEINGSPDPQECTLCPEDSCGYVSGNIVLRMCQTLPKHKNYKVYFDNYFNFPELLIKLKARGMPATGTIRADRLRGCEKTLLTEKELKKSGRGSIDLNSSIRIVRWFDNKLVQLASNYVFIDPADTVESGEEKNASFLKYKDPTL